MSDFRAYVSDISLLRADGSSVPLKLEPASSWQTGNLALIDLENGGGECINGSPETNAVATGTAPVADYAGIEFTIGVPFADNHSDPLTAAAPLDDAAMHWHWRGGYKFLRTGVSFAESRSTFHLGSTGCQGTIGSITACESPNRVTVRLPRFDHTTDIVEIDLAQLFGDAQGQACLSAPGDAGCKVYFVALGLPWDGIAASPTSVFGVAR